MKFTADTLRETKGVGVMAARMLRIAKNSYDGDYTPTNDVIDVIADWTTLINNVAGFGKTGASVSDYAFATLKWLGTPYSLERYADLIQSVDATHKNNIEKFIDSNLHKKIYIGD